MNLRSLVRQRIFELAAAVIVRGFVLACGIVAIHWLFSPRLLPKDLQGAAVVIFVTTVLFSVLVAAVRAFPSYSALKSLEETGYDLSSEFESKLFVDNFLSDHFIKLRKGAVGLLTRSRAKRIDVG